VSIRVLLADDHALVRDGLKMLLQSNGSSIVVVGETSSGREAVELAEKLRPEVAILDIAMPDLNGIEATMAIRKASPETRIIILSMHSTSEHIYRALRAGASGYVVKESAGWEAVAAVRAVLAGQKFLSAVITDTLVTDFTRDSHPIHEHSPIERLSPRERQILQLVAEGGSSAEIGRALGLSPKTVDTYRSRLMAKLGVKNLAGLVKLALRFGVASPE
jgi:DNA-binding NarL/FixJ family response regulator